MEYKVETTYGCGNDQALEIASEIFSLDLPDAEEVLFDFTKYRENNPFSNLLIANSIRAFRKNHKNKCQLRPNSATYLSHLGFYQMIGADYGKQLGEARSSDNYVPITKVTFNEAFYQTIEGKSEELAALLKFDTELSAFLKYLFYDTSWQQDVDALETRVKGYKAEKDAAEEAERQRIAAENSAKREQSLKDKYSGKLPAEGMPMSCLKYTSLGSPDEEEKCLNFNHLVEERRSISVWWYGSDGKILAVGTCFKHKGDSEFMLYSFSYYPPSASSGNGQTFHYGGGNNNSGSVRDDYDNPEDLWGDNRDWYDDEDEPWDEWENG